MAVLPPALPRARTARCAREDAQRRLALAAVPRPSPRNRIAGSREGAPVRYRARVEYDGTDFSGFQLQAGARTVQGELEAVLTRLNRGNRVRVDGAGRTDTGVHALDQVIAF